MFSDIKTLKAIANRTMFGGAKSGSKMQAPSVGAQFQVSRLHNMRVRVQYRRSSASDSKARGPGFNPNWHQSPVVQNFVSLTLSLSPQLVNYISTSKANTLLHL